MAGRRRYIVRIWINHSLRMLTVYTQILHQTYLMDPESSKRCHWIKNQEFLRAVYDFVEFFFFSFFMIWF